LNQDSKGWVNSFTLDIFVKVTAFCAAVIYGALFIGYRTYFNELGINPEDVGVGSTFVLVRSIGFIVLAVGAVAVVAMIIGVLETMQNKTDSEPHRAGKALVRCRANVAEFNERPPVAVRP
jgi:hypothetical protein